MPGSKLHGGMMAQGLSIANNLLANSVQFNLNNNQSALKNMVTQLSSGLRINSAADDPSGLAIATNLQTQVDGFNTAVQNVQNANNAAQVALGALSTTTDILQRIRSLAVEASSSLNSNQDRLNLQAEVSQLLLEVNSISQSVNFNGQPLLDGSHAGFQPQQNATATITANAALANASGSSSSNSYTLAAGATSPAFTIGGLAPFTIVTIGWTVTNSSGASVAYQSKDLVVGPVFPTSAPSGSSPYLRPTETDATGTLRMDLTNSGTSPLTFSNFTVNGTGTTPNGLGIGVNNGVNVGVNSSFLIASVTAANANFNTTIGTSVAYNALGSYATVDGTIELQVVNTGVSIAVQETFVNSATGAVSVDSTLFGANQVSSDFENTSITIGSISSLDVGTSAYLKIGQNVAALTNPNNPAFNFQSGANEGDTIQIGLQATNTQTLRISNINLALSAANNPSIGSEDAIGQIDQALNTILNQQALLGAVVVRLNEDANNDNIAAVNLQASESSIRDLNVGQATTEFTKLQVLVQVGTSVLAQSNNNAQSVLGLFR
ncbi:MAG: hypothetical protein HKL91_00635 [Candidatus Eremiobacteraeota bacterium]|uniref:Putative Flagellin n=2 Tax=mine drainage metagenome TaxID=410659 RepID=A0A3P3ZN65_9ZZZZ|nr:hypothetical protein [Candidatus Eremiobacteraeota bacterium]